MEHERRHRVHRPSGMVERAGRVPGAVHIEWTNFISDDKYHTIKEPAELRNMLEEVGVTPEKEIITY